MKNAVFEKTIKNLRSPRDSKLVTTKVRRNYLASEPNQHITFFFWGGGNLLLIEITRLG